MPMKRTIAGGLILAAVLFAGAWLFNPQAVWEFVQESLAGWQAEARERPLMVGLLFVLTYAGACALSLPISIPLSILGGALFGAWIGSVLNVLAASLGGTVAFHAARWLFRPFVEGRIARRFPGLTERFRTEGFYDLVCVRLFVIVPYTVTNLVAGVTPMPTRIFLSASVVGMWPAAFVFAGFGAKASELSSLRGLLQPQMIGLFAGLALLVGLARWAARGQLRTDRGKVPSVQVTFTDDRPEQPAGRIDC
ncbi:MAG: TVP38/TMEM64 family protein [Gemmataceae bacterium]